MTNHHSAVAHSAAVAHHASFISNALLIFITAVLLLAPPPASAGKFARLAMGAATLGAVHSYSKSRRNESPTATNTAPASTSGEKCNAQLPLAQTPSFTNPKWSEGLTKLCFQGYVVAYSSKTRTPLWSAEYLTRYRVESAKTVKRVNNFHEEEQIPAAARSRLKDFVGSGYDRGHLSPSGDAQNAEMQAETFSLANMVPQDSTNNRGIWSEYESSARAYAVKHGAVNVVTGPLFIGQKTQFLNNRIAVPTHLWKLLYDPLLKTGGVLIVANIDTREAEWKTIPEFEAASGYYFNLGSPALMAKPIPIKRN